MKYYIYDTDGEDVKIVVREDEDSGRIKIYVKSAGIASESSGDNTYQYLVKTISAKKWTTAAKKATKVVPDGEVYDAYLQHCASIRDSEYCGD